MNRHQRWEMAGNGREWPGMAGNGREYFLKGCWCPFREWPGMAGNNFLVEQVDLFGNGREWFSSEYQSFPDVISNPMVDNFCCHAGAQNTRNGVRRPNIALLIHIYLLYSPGKSPRTPTNGRKWPGMAGNGRESRNFQDDRWCLLVPPYCSILFGNSFPRA